MVLFQVITHILSFLPHDNLLDIRLTCNDLYMASLAPKFLAHEKVVFNKKYNSLEPACLLKSRRDFYHLSFEVCHKGWFLTSILCVAFNSALYFRVRSHFTMIQKFGPSWGLS